MKLKKKTRPYNSVQLFYFINILLLLPKNAVMCFIAYAPQMLRRIRDKWRVNLGERGR